MLHNVLQRSNGYYLEPILYATSFNYVEICGMRKLIQLKMYGHYQFLMVTKANVYVT